MSSSVLSQVRPRVWSSKLQKPRGAGVGVFPGGSPSAASPQGLNGLKGLFECERFPCCEHVAMSDTRLTRQRGWSPDVPCLLGTAAT